MRESLLNGKLLDLDYVVRSSSGCGYWSGRGWGLGMFYFFEQFVTYDTLLIKMLLHLCE
jgi:hypothetical protein